jgi:hypothetical protein
VKPWQSPLFLEGPTHTVSWELHTLKSNAPQHVMWFKLGSEEQHMKTKSIGNNYTNMMLNTLS